MKYSLSMLVLGCALVAPSVSRAAPPPTSHPASHTSSNVGTPAPKKISLWGTNLCLFGAPAGIRCDLTLPLPEQLAARPPGELPASMTHEATARRYSLLGRDVCVGAEADGCWLTLPALPEPSATPSPTGQRRGS